MKKKQKRFHLSFPHLPPTRQMVNLIWSELKMNDVSFPEEVFGPVFLDDAPETIQVSDVVEHIFLFSLSRTLALPFYILLKGTSP